VCYGPSPAFDLYVVEVYLPILSDLRRKADFRVQGFIKRYGGGNHLTEQLFLEHQIPFQTHGEFNFQDVGPSGREFYVSGTENLNICRKVIPDWKAFS